MASNHGTYWTDIRNISSCIGDGLAVADVLGGFGGAQVGRDAVLAGHNRTVGQCAADVGDQAFGLGKERCPGRRRGGVGE